MIETYLVVVLGGGEFCLPAAATREVVAWIEPRRIPSPNPRMLGIVPMRGALVPIYDLAGMLGLPTGRGKIVLLDDGEETIGLAVDGVGDLVRVDEAAFRPAPTASALIDGALVLEDRIVVRLRTPLGPGLTG